MRRYFPIWILVLTVTSTQAQNRAIDSVQVSYINGHNLDSTLRVLVAMPDDTTKVGQLSRLSWDFAFNQAEKGLKYGREGIELAQHLEYKKGLANCYVSIAQNYWLVGNYISALQKVLEGLHIFEELGEAEGIAWANYVVSNIYRDFGDYDKALVSVRNGLSYYESVGMPTIGYGVLGSVFELQNSLDSTLYYVNKADRLYLEENHESWNWLYYVLGNVYQKKLDYDSAMFYYRKALIKLNKKDSIETYNGIAKLYKRVGNLDSSIYYSSKVISGFSDVSFQKGLLDAAKILADNFRQRKQLDSLVKYLGLSIIISDRVYSQQNERDIQNLAFSEKQRLEDQVREQQQYQSRLRMNAVLGIAFTFLIVLLLLWRNNRNKQKANNRLQQQKAETEAQKQTAEKALEELKATQAQLVQREKMASLGELTAGIAHEIQNPLNFVNNFSETNKELLSELIQSIKDKNLGEAATLANDIVKNEDKIYHHGRRADGIVKGMIQHAKTGTGKKELTDINQLAENYFRISYQGAKAKDKNFSASIDTNFDPGIGQVNLVPEDIGRVLLNLYNNAFYTIHEKKKRSGDGYEPKVSVSTEKRGENILISVKDNGQGIPQNLLSKIFHPFFTTKPTGEGTGLGLSLSYDIITKGHGGTISAQSTEGEVTEFIVQLPA